MCKTANTLLKMLMVKRWLLKSLRINADSVWFAESTSEEGTNRAGLAATSSSSCMTLMPITSKRSVCV